MKMIKGAALFCLICAILLAGCGKDTKALPEKENDNDENARTGELISQTPESEEDDPEPEVEVPEPEEEQKMESEEVQEKEPEDNTDYEASYAPVLDEVLEAVTDGYDFEREYKYLSDGLMEKCMYPGDDDLSETVGYVLKDISGDDTPELIIGCDENYGDSKPQSYIFSLFTLKDDKPFSVFEGRARSSYQWMGENRFFYSGSGGVSITIFGENHLSGDGSEIIWDDFYFSDEKTDGGIGLYHNTSGIFDAKESEELNMSDSEFFAKMDDYESECRLLQWTPIGNEL